MSVTISIPLSAKAQALLAKAIAAPEALGPLLIAAIDEQNGLTTGHIQKARLTGKGPFPPPQGKLGVRSNRLRGSLRPSKAVGVGNTIYSAIGTNVRYAKYHEYGGTYRVPAHKRRLIAFDRYEKRGRGFVQTQSGIRGTIRAHTITFPQRAPIRRGIEDRIPNYTRALSAAVIAAYRT